MMFLRPARPNVPLADVTAAVAQRHGLSGVFRPLYGERDQGFRLDAQDGRRLLVKVMNDAEPDMVIAAQIAALDHLARYAPAISVPKVVRDLDGAAITRFTDGAGVRRRMVALTWIDGVVLEQTPVTRPLAESVGLAVAHLGRGLRGFWHEGLRHRPLLWDVREIGRIAPFIDRISGGEARALVEWAVRRFTGETAPRLEALRLQAIHNDAGAHNVVVSPDGGAVAGVIDFGDMVQASLAQDLSTTLCDTLMGTPEALGDLLAPMVEAYGRVTPLEADEIAVLHPLTAARAAITAIVTA